MANFIDAVLIEPGRTPRVVNITNSLETLQEIVGGHIESAFTFKDKTWMVCNDEGKLIGLEPNIYMLSKAGNVIDMVVGNALICGYNEEGETISLTPRQCEFYTKLLDQHVMVCGGQL